MYAYVFIHSVPHLEMLCVNDPTPQKVQIFSA